MSADPNDEWGEGGWGEGVWGGAQLSSDTAQYTFDGNVWRTTEYNDSTLELLDGLPTYLNNDVGTTNAAILAANAEQINRLDSDLSAIEREMRVQTAENMGSLEEIAKLVDLTPLEAESVEHFRARIIGHMHAESSHGTVDELIVGVARMIRTDVQNINIDSLAPREITIEIPQSRMNYVGMTPQTIARIGEKMVSPTVDITVTLYGTFTYGSQDDGGTSDNYEYGYVSQDSPDSGTGGTMSALVDEDDAPE